MSTADRIRTIREQRDLTQEAFAEAIGRSRSLIAAWETGKKEPGRDALRLIEKTFGVPISYILGDQDDVSAVANGPHEVTLIELFREADEQTRQFVLHTLNMTRKKND